MSNRTCRASLRDPGEIRILYFADSTRGAKFRLVNTYTSKAETQGHAEGLFIRCCAKFFGLLCPPARQWERTLPTSSAGLAHAIASFAPARFRSCLQARVFLPLFLGGFFAELPLPCSVIIRELICGESFFGHKRHSISSNCVLRFCNRRFLPTQLYKLHSRVYALIRVASSDSRAPQFAKAK